jgi:carboxymethylenebutenolidase
VVVLLRGRPARRVDHVTKAVQDLMVEVERIRDAFLDAVLRPDPDAAHALLSRDATLDVDPAGTGASGAEPIRRFVADLVAPGLPADLTVRRHSRTGDRWRVVDEASASFTHDREMPWLLPGVAATGRAVEVDLVTVVVVRRSLVSRARLVWDLLGLAGQLGIDPGALPRRQVGPLRDEAPRGA